MAIVLHRRVSQGDELRLPFATQAHPNEDEDDA
jgi:hypothetical protein